MQCSPFGEPRQVAVEVVDTPGPSLIAIADPRRMPAKAPAGAVFVVVCGGRIGPLNTRPLANSSRRTRAQKLIQMRGLYADRDGN